VIPELVDVGASWHVLPPGVHDATFEEIEECFATNGRRQALYRGLIRGCKALKSAGCTVVYLDGSFVTEKPMPNDYDVCWNPFNVDADKLDPVFLDFTSGWSKQKSKYGVEYFPSSTKADGNIPFIKYFQTSKDTGTEKGIIRIYL
jgi:hypothetical protein